jgi:hypothetical protein
VGRKADDGAPAVTLAVVAGEPAALAAAGRVFPGIEQLVLSRDELRPAQPFAGPLFERLAAQSAGACVALVVPCVWSGAGEAPRPVPPRGTSGLAPLLAITDHVNLALRGPLSGRWPAGVPRTFPPLAGVYQPAIVRSCGGPQVYSSGVAVAGVADAGRLTPFEASVIHERRLPALADLLVPSVIAAAYYGLTVAACGVLRADDNDEQ